MLKIRDDRLLSFEDYTVARAFHALIMMVFTLLLVLHAGEWGDMTIAGDDTWLMELRRQLCGSFRHFQHDWPLWIDPQSLGKGEWLFLQKMRPKFNFRINAFHHFNLNCPNGNDKSSWFIWGFSSEGCDKSYLNIRYLTGIKWSMNKLYFISLPKWQTSADESYQCFIACFYFIVPDDSRQSNLHLH